MLVVTTKKPMAPYHSTHHFPYVDHIITNVRLYILFLLYSRRLNRVILTLVDDIKKEASIIVSQNSGKRNSEMESVTRAKNLRLGYKNGGNTLSINERVLRETPRKFLPTTSIVIPAFNEEAGLPVVLENIFRVVDGTCEVVVVDDGSHDKTSEVASRFPCKIVKHVVNRGKAEAMKTGIRHARGENVIFIDADGTYPVEVIPQMVETLKSCDAVYGSRSTGRDNIPYFNRLGNAMFQNMMKRIYGFKASDYSTGLYGLRKRYLEMMDIKSCGFDIEVEIAAKASRMQLRVKEIPIEYRSRLGNSKLCGWKVGVGHLKTILSHLTWRGSQRNGHEAPTPVISFER